GSLGKRLLAGIVLYLLTCRRCLSPFAICESCYRGQWYCGWRCRLLARIRSRRASNRREQMSWDGRLGHADRQAQYRARILAGQKVTGQSSQVRMEFPTLLERHAPNAGATLVVNGVAVCRVCGRSGPFIDPPRGGGRDRSRDGGPDSPALLRRALAGGHDRGGAGPAPRDGGAGASGRDQGEAGSATEPIRPLRGLRPRAAGEVFAAVGDGA